MFRKFQSAVQNPKKIGRDFRFGFRGTKDIIAATLY
jgi:hypothetical protein